MLFKFVAFIIFLVVCLLGYLFYSEYKDNILFRGESFKESYGVKVILDLLIPKDTKVIDNRLFYVFGSTTVRDFYVIKIIVFLCSIIVTFSVTYTNVLNNKLAVFTSSGELPYVISESDYEILVNGLSFQQLDAIDDQRTLNKNIKYSDNYSRYSLTDIELLYSTLDDMTYDLDNVFGITEMLVAVILLVLGWCLPELILLLLFKWLKSDMSYEFAKLESYIYLNCDQRVEHVLVGLANEAIVYRELFKAFLLRYREDRFLSYSLILGNAGFTQEFKTLIEYLSLLENGTPEIVKSKIVINRKSYMDKLKFDIRKSSKDKKDILSVTCIVSIVIGLGGVLVSLIMSAL